MSVWDPQMTSQRDFNCHCTFPHPPLPSLFVYGQPQITLVNFRVPAPGGYGLRICIQMAQRIVENKGSDFQSLVYMSGLVFPVPHLNLTLDYHLEV